jgi:hypothetical protein
VNAGGDVGVVHRPCFARWDTEQEALEQMLARSLGAPHHAEANVELEFPTDAAAKSSPSLLPRANSLARAELAPSAAA